MDVFGVPLSHDPCVLSREWICLSYSLPVADKLPFKARCLGSQFHCIKPVSGAISAVYNILVPISSLPSPSEPVKAGSRATFAGHAYVAYDPIIDWEARSDDASKLLGKLSALHDAFRKKWKLSKRVEDVVDE